MQRPVQQQEWLNARRSGGDPHRGECRAPLSHPDRQHAGKGDFHALAVVVRAVAGRREREGVLGFARVEGEAGGDPGVVAEGSTVTVTVTLAPALDRAVVIPLETQGYDGATPGDPETRAADLGPGP